MTSGRARHCSFQSTAAETRTRRFHALGERDRHLGAHEAAHRVAHHRRPLDAELVHDGPDGPAVALDADGLGGHLGEPEPRQVERDDAVLGRHVRDVLQPGLPVGSQAVDEDHRRPLADVDEVDPAAFDVEPSLVLAPVDAPPLGVQRRAIVVPTGLSLRSVLAPARAPAPSPRRNTLPGAC